jgi:hypothetical protein
VPEPEEYIRLVSRVGPDIKDEVAFSNSLEKSTVKVDFLLSVFNVLPDCESAIEIVGKGGFHPLIDSGSSESGLDLMLKCGHRTFREE